MSLCILTAAAWGLASDADKRLMEGCDEKQGSLHSKQTLCVQVLYTAHATAAHGR